MARHGSLILILTFAVGVSGVNPQPVSRKLDDGEHAEALLRGIKQHETTGSDPPEPRKASDAAARRIPNALFSPGSRGRLSHLRSDLPDGGMRALPRLAFSSDYQGPVDPADPSRLAICNPQVRRALNVAWGESVQAAHRAPVSINDKVEYGFAIQLNNATHALAVQEIETSDMTGNKPNELVIAVNDETIATVHTHNLGARPTPSAADVASELPAFVKSQFYLYVTIPGTSTYSQINLNEVCGSSQ
jgi:hypothetical protein